jgi:hypothetical protein
VELAAELRSLAGRVPGYSPPASLARQRAVAAAEAAAALSADPTLAERQERWLQSPSRAVTGHHRSCLRHRRTTAADPSGQRHAWVEYTPSKEIYDAWEALPLIVLAGLR